MQIKSFMVLVFICGSLLFFPVNCSDSSNNNGANNRDTEAPVAELLNTPSSITNSDEINITVAGDGVVLYRYSLDGADWSGDLNTGTPITASGISDGAHTLSVTGCDSAGNRQSEDSATVFGWSVDTAKPAGTFTINNDDAVTHLYWTGLYMNITGASEMRFKNEDSDWSAWEPYANLKKWLLTGQTDHKHVFVQAMDLAGNILEADDEIVFESKLTASDGAAGDIFAGSGLSFSSSGDVLIAGACNDDDKGTDSGSVYVYRWDSEEKKITASDGGANHLFGQSVSISSDGNTAVVGAPNHNKAYIYEWDGSSWSETILAPSGAGSNYGYRVSISGDGNTVIIGAQVSNLVYIYRKNTDDWDEINAAVTGINFSWSVALTQDGNYAAVGDYNTNSISILNWNIDHWVETKLNKAASSFGWSVDISDDGETLIVGAPGGNSAYIYKWITDSWSETVFTGAAGGEFGRRVALSSDANTAVVGAPNENKAYIYQWNNTTWDKTELTAGDAATGDLFGFYVDISADGLNVAVGSRADDSSKGSAYILRWNGTDWIGY